MPGIFHFYGNSRLAYRALSYLKVRGQISLFRFLARNVSRIIIAKKIAMAAACSSSAFVKLLPGVFDGNSILYFRPFFETLLPLCELVEVDIT